MTLKRIEKALTALVMDQPFFAVLAMKLNISKSKEFTTFATDGKNLFINPDFLNTLKDREIVTVLTHEVLHCALGHVWRMPNGANMKKWNIATDNEVNHELENYNQSTSGACPFPWPDCGKILDSQFKGMCAEKIYSALPDEKEENNGGKPPKEGNGKNPKNFGEVIPCPKDEKDKLKNDWDKALIQAEKAAKNKGSIPGSIQEKIKGIKSNKVDWQSILKDCLSAIAADDYSFRYPNLRYTDNDFILPSLFSEKIGKIIFAIDTSGSINQDLLKMFLAEAQSALDALNPEKLSIIQCDTKINKINNYEPGDIISLKVYGRGGTDFRPVFEHCEKMDDAPIALVYLTDLDGSFPDKAPGFPVFWITKNGEKTVPFGDVITVE